MFQDRINPNTKEKSAPDHLICAITWRPIAAPDNQRSVQTSD